LLKFKELNYPHRVLHLCEACIHDPGNVGSVGPHNPREHWEGGTMAQTCVGSFYGQDWSVYTREDAIACENAGGHVVQTSDVCGASSVAAMAATPDNPTRGAVAELALTPFREVRAEAANHELVQALVQLNSAAGPEIERIAAADEGLRAELIQAFLTVSGLAAAVTRKMPPHGRLEERAFGELESLWPAYR
jgi:hypothetical protein